jgi:hypothetical protein
MDARKQLARLIGSGLVTTVALAVLSVDAMAAKEKFQRSKPHVNVGTIGSPDSGQQDNLIAPMGTGTASPQPGSLAGDCAQDPSTPTGQPTPPC